MNNRLHRELQFADYLRIIIKNRWLFLFCAVSFVGPTFWFTSRIPDTYIAESQLVMDEEKTRNLMLMEQSSSSHNIGYYRALFQSSAFQNNLNHALTIPVQEAGITEGLQGYGSNHLSLNEGFIESFLSVTSKTPSAHLSFELARLATDSLIVFCSRVANQESEKTIIAIKEQIEVCMKKREEIAQERSTLTDASRLATLGDFEGLTALEKSYQEELVKYELDKANLEAKKNYFSSLDKALHGNSKKEDTTINRLRARLRELEKEKEKMARLGITLSPENRLSQDLQEVEEQIMRQTRNDEPQDISIIRQWQTIRKEVALMESEMQLKKARLGAFKNAIRNYQIEHPDLGKHEFQLQQLDNLFERYSETHKRLTERLEDAVIHLQSKTGGLKLVDGAQIPTKPVARRDYVFYLVALIVSLGLGVGLSFLREFMDDTVKTPDDVEKQLALTLLGTIPHIQVKKTDLHVRRSVDKNKRVTLSNRYPELVLGPGKEESVVAEAFRTLRTNIVFASPDKPIHALLVTSSGPGEGKSLTLANTALSFAQQGEPTLIVDNDLRRPVMHHLFGLDRGPGFGELFSNTLSMNEAIREVPGTQLKILTAGAFMPNPSEVLGSKKMNSLITELKERFRYILFDTPPVIAVTDACLLASKLDGVVLMVRANKTNITVANRALQALGNVNARVLGCILNDVDITKGYSSYGYYKQYYHYYLTRKD